MFGEGGHLYVYFTYGMHFCANVVTGRKGRGEAVLIRAVEPVEGIALMRGNRGIGASGRGGVGATTSASSVEPRKGGNGEKNLTNGPAKFCQAFGIGRKHNGTDLLGNHIFIVEGETIPAKMIGRSSRIGIRKGIEKQWRFFVKENGWVTGSTKP